MFENLLLLLAALSPGLGKRLGLGSWKQMTAVKPAPQLCTMIKARFISSHLKHKHAKRKHKGAPNVHQNVEHI